MISKKSDDAVSPVIGVMLMLVVTVVIAAAVTIFATGVVGETEAAPVAVLDVEILSSVEALEGMRGPELFITHLSGDAVDTDDIELRFSWNCGVDGCTYGGTHYSTYSAEEMSKHIDKGVLGKKTQALYVKSTMEVQKENPKYGSTGGLNHYFGDVILTPGLKLTALSEFLPDYDSTDSPFMDVIFDNYHVSTTKTEEKKLTRKGWNIPHHPDKWNQYDENCYKCTELKDWGYGEYGCDYGKQAKYKNAYGMCNKCLTHPEENCTEDCTCITARPTGNFIYTRGIMEHLQPGTAVDVMIVHIPSGKAIYDNTVIVQ